MQVGCLLGFGNYCAYFNLTGGQSFVCSDVCACSSVASITRQHDIILFIYFSGNVTPVSYRKNVTKPPPPPQTASYKQYTEIQVLYYIPGFKLVNNKTLLRPNCC